VGEKTNGQGKRQLSLIGELEEEVQKKTVWGRGALLTTGRERTL